MKKVVWIFILMVSFSVTAPAQNVAYVDVQKIMNNSVKGKKLKLEIQEKVKYYQSRLENIDKQISQIQKQLESPILSEEAKKKKKEELQNLKEQTIKIQQEAEEELSQMKAKAEKELVLDIKRITQEYAKKHNIDLVFIGGVIGGVVYYDSAIDITDKILEKYNKETK